MHRGFRASVVLAAALLAAGAAVVGQPRVTVTVKARQLQPGELTVLTVTAPATAIGVTVRAFDRQYQAFRVTPGSWQTLVGIDLETKPGRYEAQVTAVTDVETLTAAQPLVITAKTFATRRLRVAPDYVNPSSPEMVARITSEAARIAEVFQQSAAERLWSSAFVRPVPQAANSAFGTRSVYNGVRRSSHAGADFRSPAGTPIQAPNGGRVLLARDLFFTGNTVILDHGLGVFSMLAHLSRIDVSEGEVVTAGQLLGLVGATGRVTGAHLHWGFTVSGARVDPLSALAMLGGADSSLVLSP